MSSKSQTTVQCDTEWFDCRHRLQICASDHDLRYMICFDQLGRCPDQHDIRFVCIRHQIFNGKPPFDRLWLGLKFDYKSALIDEAFIERNSWVSSAYWWWLTPWLLMRSWWCNGYHACLKTKTWPIHDRFNSRRRLVYHSYRVPALSKVFTLYALAKIGRN